MERTAAEPSRVVKALAEQHIIVDYRPGHVRVSPYFYNTIDEQIEIERGGRSVLMRAGVGWDSGIVGKLRLNLNLQPNPQPTPHNVPQKDHSPRFRR